MTKLANEVL